MRQALHFSWLPTVFPPLTAKRHDTGCCLEINEI